MENNELKALLLAEDSSFWDRLKPATSQAVDFDELFALSTLRRKAHARGLPRPGRPREALRLALLGGYNFYPFRDLLQHLSEMEGTPCQLWEGAFDNYLSEILDESSELYRFAPQVIFLMPAAHRCVYTGSLTDSRQAHEAEVSRVSESVVHLAIEVHRRTGAEIIVTNFRLPAQHDPGAYRSRTLGSDWNFRKAVNLELGLIAPPFLHICDLEFLAYRLGGNVADDPRAWFESKQPGSPRLLLELAREVVNLISRLRKTPKKVLVLDLDNTLWGGVLADDGPEGIELGDTSPRGEAYKALQKYILTLKDRGTLLAVASKNDHEIAVNALQNHPEMLLRADDFVALKINWDPKSDNLRRIAEELNVGLDSLVFVDDNPAEIEIVRRFTPEVAAILLGPDPSEYVTQLKDCRLFEPIRVTQDDTARTRQYQAAAQGRALAASASDMQAYLQSLEMELSIARLNEADTPRVAQLINKSNQFNLTTRRRSEAEIRRLLDDPVYTGISARLRDRFGDHGLIAVVIGQTKGDEMEIDTWLMSCRVLKRQVEDELLNGLADLARQNHCRVLKGVYKPTAKNEMVRDFYPQMGFAALPVESDELAFELPLAGFAKKMTPILVTTSSQ